MLKPILLVDDDTGLNHLIQEFLSFNGFNVVVETQGKKVVDLIFRHKPILVILDIVLPGQDGLTICRTVRNLYKGPILILSGLADDIDQVAGLEIGADAYLTKPITPRVWMVE